MSSIEKNGEKKHLRTAEKTEVALSCMMDKKSDFLQTEVSGIQKDDEGQHLLSA